MFRSGIRACAVSALAALGSFAAWPASAPAANPWAGVPPAPTSYYQADNYSAKIDSAAANVNNEIEQRKTTNQELQSSAEGSNGDPMAMAQRMQQMMMDDPQAAAKMMQVATGGGTTAAPTAVSTESAAMLEREQRLTQERGRLAEQYHAALNTAMKPFRARYVALAKRADPQSIPTEAGPMWPDWAVKELDGLLREADAAYVALAGQWFGPGGQFTASLTAYRNFLVNERTPFRERTTDQATLLMLKLKNVPSGAYKSTASLEGVQDYLKAANTVYRRRSQQASCAQTPCTDWLRVEERPAK